MSDLTFQMRLKCHYTSSANNVDSLAVEHLVDKDWRQLDLNTTSPGFDIFMYSILTCQHMYFRLNAAERNLVLDSSEGLVTIGTDAHRVIETLHIDFIGKLKSGEADDSNSEYIKERMGQCPVSINLKDISDSKTTVSFIR